MPLTLNGGRTGGGHPKGHIPQRYRGQPCDVIAVGDLDAFLAGHEGVEVVFADKALKYTGGTEPRGSFYIDEFADPNAAAACAREVAAAPVQLIERRGGLYRTSRGEFNLDAVHYADAGKNPRMTEAVVEDVRDLLAGLLPVDQEVA
jgi:hypothetical protein